MIIEHTKNHYLLRVIEQDETGYIVSSVPSEPGLKLAPTEYRHISFEEYQKFVEVT